MTYRFSLTEQELLAHGEGAHDAEMNAGVVTWTLSKGHWQSVQKPVDPSVEHTTCEGWYDVHGAEAIFTITTTYAGGTCAAKTWSARWSYTNRQLTWSAISEADFRLRVGRQALATDRMSRPLRTLGWPESEQRADPAVVG